MSLIFVYTLLVLKTSKYHNEYVCAGILTAVSFFMLLLDFSIQGLVLLGFEYALAVVAFKFIRDYEGELLKWFLAVFGGLALINIPDIVINYLKA